MEQEYIIENIKSFNPVHIFECGQCFRWNKENDGSYTGIFGENVINVKNVGGAVHGHPHIQKNTIIFKGICNR